MNANRRFGETRAKAENVLRVGKFQFGYSKVRCCGIVRKRAQESALLTLANLLVAGPLSEREAGSAKSPRAQSRNAATPGDLHHCPDCRPDAKQITKVTVAQRFLV